MITLSFTSMPIPAANRNGYTLVTYDVITNPFQIDIEFAPKPLCWCKTNYL